MPNHVTTRMTFKGDLDKIRKLMSSISTEHPSVHCRRFNNSLIYCKDTVGGKVYGYWDESKKEFELNDESCSKHPSILAGFEPSLKVAFIHRIDFDKIIPTPPSVIQCDLSMSEQASTRGHNWLDWRISNWGTKWNSYSTVLDDKGRIVFDTAWSCPNPVLLALSKLFPDVELHIETFDEGSCFWGTMLYLVVL